MEEKNESLMVNDLESLVQNRKTKQQIFTNIDNVDDLFNLEGECDFKINDCIGEKIRVKKVLVKEFTKKVDEKDEKGNSIINEETGEVNQIDETTIITILVDDNNKSYVTKSKMFAMRLRNYLGMYGFSKLNSDEGVVIEITTQKVKNSGFSALSFKLIKD